ncbi:hypothetical protein [Pararhizobium sp. PWRC1-1]|uniref:hypothetical protein n=1 Tax=Pararhizobium sp. PWRC1-1 TaxID=2804566 RepID=UPI003CE6E121
MTNATVSKLAEFAHTDCTVFFWLGEVPDETFCSLERAVRHVNRHPALADSVEIFVHSATTRPPIISGEDLVVLMKRVEHQLRRFS